MQAHPIQFLHPLGSTPRGHNHVAVWAVVLLHQAMGYVWYSPWLFLPPWLSGQGRIAPLPAAPDAGTLLWSFAGNFLTAYTLSWLIRRLGIRSFVEGAKLGVLLFLGFAILDLGAHYRFLGIADVVLAIDLSLLGVWTVLATGLLAAWAIEPRRALV